MKFSILNTEVFGYEKAIKASGNPMRVEFDRDPLTDKDIRRAEKLGSTVGGQGHDNYLKGIVVQFDIISPLYWWKQAQRYHWFDFVSSQSTMHCLLKFDVATQCVEDTSPKVIEAVKELVSEYFLLPETEIEAKNKKWREIVASLPCGFCLGATMTTNYQQLKTMYNQRKHHKLVEWKEFCAWCKTLPHFLELTGCQE
jgi:hypothetical protein